MTLKGKPTNRLYSETNSITFNCAFRRRRDDDEFNAKSKEKKGLFAKEMSKLSSHFHYF